MLVDAGGVVTVVVVVVVVVRRVWGRAGVMTVA
jgi:hypothetical protein